MVTLRQFVLNLVIQTYEKIIWLHVEAIATRVWTTQCHVYAMQWNLSCRMSATTGTTAWWQQRENGATEDTLVLLLLKTTIVMVTVLLCAIHKKYNLTNNLLVIKAVNWNFLSTSNFFVCLYSSQAIIKVAFVDVPEYRFQQDSSFDKVFKSKPILRHPISLRCGISILYIRWAYIWKTRKMSTGLTHRYS